MEGEFLGLSDSESSTSSSDNNSVANATAPPSSRFKCGHCSKTFSFEQELINHKDKSSSRKASFKQAFLKFLEKNPQVPPPPSLGISTHDNRHAFRAIGPNGFDTHHHRFHPYMRPREHQFFPTSPDADDSLMKTMDLLSMIDGPAGSVPNQKVPEPIGIGASEAVAGSVPNQKVPEPSGVGASEAVAGWGASIGLDVVDLELKL